MQKLFTSCTEKYEDCSKLVPTLAKRTGKPLSLGEISDKPTHVQNPKISLHNTA